MGKYCHKILQHTKAFDSNLSLLILLSSSVVLDLCHLLSIHRFIKWTIKHARMWDRSWVQHLPWTALVRHRASMLISFTRCILFFWAGSCYPSGASVGMDELQGRQIVQLITRTGNNQGKAIKKAILTLSTFRGWDGLGYTGSHLSNAGHIL